MEYGNRIKKFRKKVRLSQQQIANQLNYTQPTISRYEKNLRMPDADFLEKMSTVYQLNINWVLTGKGKMFNYQYTEISTQPKLEDEVNSIKNQLDTKIIDLKKAQDKNNELLHENILLQNENQILKNQVIQLMKEIVDCKNEIIKLQGK